MDPLKVLYPTLGVIPKILLFCQPFLLWLRKIIERLLHFDKCNHRNHKSGRKRKVKEQTDGKADSLTEFFGYFIVKHDSEYNIYQRKKNMITHQAGLAAILVIR